MMRSFALSLYTLLLLVLMGSSGCTEPPPERVECVGTACLTPLFRAPASIYATSACEQPLVNRTKDGIKLRLFVADDGQVPRTILPSSLLKAPFNWTTKSLHIHDIQLFALFRLSR